MTTKTDLELYIETLNLLCKQCLIAKRLCHYNNLMTEGLSNYRVCDKCQGDKEPTPMYTCQACKGRIKDMGYNMRTKEPYKTCVNCRAYNRDYKAKLRAKS